MSKAYAYADKNTPDQSGKTIIITGGNSGIGYEAGVMLAKKGARIVLACRSTDKAANARDDMLKHAPNAQVDVMPLDLAALDSVRAFAAQVLNDYPRIDVLINNAGVMAIPYAETADGFEMQFGTNHLGHFALTGLLFERLVVTEGARIVNIASIAHKSGTMHFEDLNRKQNYKKWEAYCQSKLANLLFTYELARRLKAKGSGLIVAAAHPGWSATNLQRSSPMAWFIGLFIAQSQAMGALPTVYAATMPDVQSGDYIGPGGPMEVWGFPKKVQSIRRAHKEDWMTQLWEKSQEMTGITVPV